MKQKLLMAFITLLSCEALIAQQNPTGTGLSGNATNPSQAVNLANSAWYRGGNFPVGGNPANANIFGTMWNSPIYTVTNGANRMKLNGTLDGLTQYTINGFPFAGGVNTSGYLLLGENNNTPLGNPLFTSKGAFSLLHLNGAGSFVQEGGYRPWMKTGVYMNEESNNIYVGMYKSSNNLPSDGVINWGDDNSSNNRLRIIFTPSIGNFSTPGSPVYNRDQEMMSFWFNRNVGIGDFINFTMILTLIFFKLVCFWIIF